jgi:Immunoglobulin domain
VSHAMSQVKLLTAAILVLVTTSTSAQTSVGINFVTPGLSITNEPEPTAISVGPSGSKLYTFDEPPSAREFSSFLWRGGNDGRTDTITNIDAKVQLLDATNINQALTATAGTPPPVFFGPARWASQGGYLVTRPTGTAGDVILGRLRNDSGVAKSAIIVSYDLTVEFPTIEEAPGYLVYYSLAGVPGSWVPVPGIPGDGSTGHKVFILDLSATPWIAGSFLYILWVDDNGSGEPDSAVELDNFRVTFPCPGIPVSIVRSPTSVITNEGATVRFNIVAAGPAPLTYQWFKSGSTLSDDGNISGATTAQLTIADASLSDAGSYICRVSNIDCSLSGDSAPATLTILPDSTRPALTNAVNTVTTVTLTFSKAMSIATARNTPNYVFTPPVAVNSAVLSDDGRTVILITSARAFPNKYRLTITGLRDNHANANLLNPNPTVVDLTSSIAVGSYSDLWKYQTNNLDDQAWTLPDYNDGVWRMGRGFFGTEESADVTNALPSPHILTVIPPNNDTANTNAFVTSYFRRQVTLPALTAGTAYILSHYTDDGAVFYLDGMEIGRYQMPAGTPTFVTRSTGGNVEAVLQTFFFSASPGLHTLAVEVHQVGVTSPDVVFGANISAVTLPGPLTIQSGGNTGFVQWSADSSWQLVGSQIVDGNYLPVSGVPFGYYSIPLLTQTNQFFYELRYISQP